MNIVWFGQHPWDDRWPARQPLVSRLARRGHRVLYINPQPAGSPPGIAGLAGWRRRCAVEKVQDGLHVLTRRPVSRIGAGWIDRQTLRSGAEALGLWAPVVVCQSASQRGLIRAVRPAATIYFAPTGAAAAGGADEEALIRECDVALAGSSVLLDRFLSIQPTSFLQPDGVDVEHFRQAAEGAEGSGPLKGLARPRLGYVGDLDETVDQALLVRLARRFPASSIVLAGRMTQPPRLTSAMAEPNVHVLENSDARSVSEIYCELDVGLVPCAAPGGHGHAARVFEYLAADLPTVATAAAQLDGTAPAIDVGRTPEEFLDAVERALADPDALRDHRQRIAETASWQRRADQLEERMALALSLAAERRRKLGRKDPPPDRHGRQVVRVEPRLDGKDASVRLLHDNYRHNGLSPQQQALYFLSRAIGMAYYALRRGSRLLRGDASAVRRILVVRNGHLGDTVVFLPTLAALRARYPRARITVALAPGSGAQPLLEASPYVDEVLPLDFFNRSRRDRFLGAARLLARGFDLAVGGVWYFHLPEAVFSGAPRRLGLYDGHPLQRYADRVVMLDPNLHEAENNLRLVELVTGPLPRELRVPRLKLDERLLAARGSQVRQKLGIPREAPVVAMHPGSKRPSRRWPAASFAELAGALLAERPDLHVVCTGAGTEEQGLIAMIRRQIKPELRGRFHDAVGIADLVGVIGFYDTCNLLVCNDTGVMHVARARGVPLVAIIGPENDRRWGPHPLGPAPAVAVRQQVPGTPHGRWSCPWNLSLGSIDALRIKRHVDALLDGTFEQASGLAPIGDGPMRLYPLLPDVRRLSFAQLLEMGLKLPRVAAILTRDPALLGEEGEPADATALAAAGRALRRQVYPMIDALIVTDRPRDFDGLDPGQARVIGVAPDDPDGAWAAVLAATDASLFWPTSAGKHPPTAISSRVGVYLRGPQADVMDGERAWPIRTLISRPLLSGRWLLTRDALQEMILHPMQIAEPQSMDDWHAPLEPAAA
jgi:ADP-heptose:LPS heptosyltransferase/glycosyltransferase involved in cell wall biosynthesis